MGVYVILTIRTPPWETIGFTQTGQRSGELIANSDQVSAQESLGAEVCVSSYFAAAKGAVRPDRAQYLTGGNPVWKGETAPPVASLGFVVVIP